MVASKVRTFRFLPLSKAHAYDYKQVQYSNVTVTLYTIPHYYAFRLKGRPLKS